MAPTLPDDPILPGATWRPLTLRDATALYERVGFVVNRRFVRLRRPAAG